MEKTEFDAEKIWKVIEGSRQHAVKKKLPSSRPNLLTLLNNSLVEWIEKCNNKCARKSGGLLEGLVSAGLQVSIIVNLYGDSDGYSIMLPQSGEQGDQKEVALPYDDLELLNYIEANEIPPVMLELLATSSSTHFYSGCIVAEVRNFRGFFHSPNHCERTYLLLHPTQETLLSTVEQARRMHQLTYEQVLAVEGHLLKATSPQLCLDPTSDVLCVANRLQYGRNKFRTYSMRRYLRKQLPGYRRSQRVLSRLSAPEPLRLHNFVSRLDQKKAPSLNVGVSTASGSGTTLHDLHRVQLTVPGSLDKFSIDFAKYLVIDQAALSPTSPLPAIQNPVSFGALMDVSQTDEEQCSVFLNYPRVASPPPVAIAPPTQAPTTPTIQPPVPPLPPAIPPTHPRHPAVPAVLPPSTTPPPIVQPPPRPPAPPTPPQVAPHNLIVLKYYEDMLRTCRQPTSSWTNLTVALPTPTTPATVTGPLPPPPQVSAVPVPSTHPMGMPILPPSAISHNTKSYTKGRVTVTTRVLSPSSQPVLSRPSRPPQIVKHSETVPKPPLVGANKPTLVKPEIIGVGQVAPTLRPQMPPALRTAPPPLRSNSPTLQRPPPGPSLYHHKLQHPASTSQVPPLLHRAGQQLGHPQTMLLTPPRFQGPTLGEPQQQLPLRDRNPHSSVPPMMMRPSLLSGAASSHAPFANTAPPQLSRATRMQTAPPPLRGAPWTDTHTPPVAYAPPPLRGALRSDTHTPPIGSVPPPLRGVKQMGRHTPPLVTGLPPPLTDKHTPPTLLHPEGKKPLHSQDKQ